MRTRIVLLALALICGGNRSAAASDGCTTDGRYVMGTVLQIELCDADAARRRVLLDDAFDLARRLDAIFTTYADGPTTRLNAHAGLGSIAVPPELAELLASSREQAVLTRGTFDVTVGPLVDLWRDAGVAGRLPSPEALAPALTRVGGERIVLDPGGTSVALAAGTAVNFGGIAKGYAVDRIAARFRAAGETSALIDFGRSSISALGTPPDAPAWRLLLEHPGGTIGVLSLRDQALSVSGSLGQVVEIDGRRLGHVIDPRTGQPLERDLVAVVVAPDATQAEALSKALLVLGESEGIEFLERLPGVRATMIEWGGRSWATPNWGSPIVSPPTGGR